jgi:hypothetical protein
MNSGFMRSRRDRDRWIQATGEPWDQKFRGYRLSGVQNLREFLFDCRSHEVQSIEGSCKHVAPPLGGDRVVDRWCYNKHPEKGGSG